MNKVEIYYFSGTGNSFVVARDVAKKINAETINIVSIIDKESINSDANVIGFVFPIYDFKHPYLVDNIIKKFDNLSSKYIFAICTYGINPSNSMKIFDKLIISYGGKLAAGFAIQMPHNGIGSSLFTKKKHQVFYNNWKRNLEEIREYIIAGKKGKIETSNLIINIIFSGLLFKVIPLILKLLKQVITKGLQSLAFTYNEKCDGCRICYKICPVNNIKIIDNRPLWLSDKCVGCFACLNWCPKQAIQLGNKNIAMINYHHPEVKISDIIYKK